MFPSDSDYTRGYAIARSDMCNEIRALLPTEWPQMYKGLEQDFSTPETEVVPGAFSPDHFESWLASKPRGESYDWLGVCLYQQYGEYCGLGIGDRAYLDAVAAIKAHTNQPLGGEPFRFVASERPHTFGGALRRLRTQRHGLFGAARLYFREWRAASSRLAALQGKG